MVNRWLRFGNRLPEALEKSRKAGDFIDDQSFVDMGLIFSRTFMYYLDVVFDFLVGWQYFADEEFPWAAVTWGILGLFLVCSLMHNHEMAAENNVSIFRTAVVGDYIAPTLPF